MEIKKSIEQGFANGGLFNILTDLQNTTGVLPIAGTTYYVSKNGNGTTGLSWKNAFTTLESAITANNLSIGTIGVGTEWYKMNRMFVDGGNYAESLVVFPSHCEMIGVGAAPARISVSTVLTTAPSVCKIYNMQFRTVTAAPVFLLPDGSQGIEFYNCIFNGSGVTPTIGLSVGSGSYALKVINCEFIGLYSSTCGIKFKTDTVATVDIFHNFISAVTYGIYFETPMVRSYQVLIKDNVLCRTDGNYSVQLAYGIYQADTGNRSDVMIVDNYISAVDGLYGADANKTISNHLIVASNGYLETEETP